MIKIFCDKCGKQITNKSLQVTLNFNPCSSPDLDKYNEYHFHISCAEEVKKGLYEVIVKKEC